MISLVTLSADRRYMSLMLNRMLLKLMSSHYLMVNRSFKGAVGDYTFDAKLNKLETKSNEPLTLNINILGTGNIKLVDMPEINLPNGFEKYEPKINEQIERKGKVSGSKSGEYLFVPRVVGIREIRRLNFLTLIRTRKSMLL